MIAKQKLPTKLQLPGRSSFPKPGTYQGRARHGDNTPDAPLHTMQPARSVAGKIDLHTALQKLW
jgi:hypothetical protein